MKRAWLSTAALGAVLAAAAVQKLETPEPRVERTLRERIEGDLTAIEQAAEHLLTIAQGEEQRAVADRIRWLARTLRQDILAGVPPPGEGADASAARAHPDRWVPVSTARQVFTPWGTNPRDVPPGGTRNRSFSGEHHRAIARGGAIVGTFTAQHRSFSWRDCIFEGAPGEDGAVRTRWGIRAYDVIDWTFDHCEWRNIPDEHGCYLSAPGSVRWRRCRFANIGSQAIQIVYRSQPPYAHETSDPSLRQLGGLHHVEECLFLECGKPTGGRPAYALSFFEGPTAAVRIERSYVRTVDSPHLSEKGTPCQSYGAIMVHDRPSVELIDTYVEYRKPSRDVIQIWDVAEVLIEGCEIVEGVVELRNCKRVVLRGNRGKATVRIGSGAPYVWPLSRLDHEGPITKDVEITLD